MSSLYTYSFREVTGYEVPQAVLYCTINSNALSDEIASATLNVWGDGHPVNANNLDLFDSLEVCYNHRAQIFQKYCLKPSSIDLV